MAKVCQCARCDCDYDGVTADVNSGLLLCERCGDYAVVSGGPCDGDVVCGASDPTVQAAWEAKGYTIEDRPDFVRIYMR